MFPKCIFLLGYSVTSHRLGCGALTCSSRTQSGSGAVFWWVVWWSAVRTRAGWGFSGEIVQHLHGTDLGRLKVSMSSVSFRQHRLCTPPNSRARVSELETEDPESTALFPPGFHLSILKTKHCLHGGICIYSRAPESTGACVLPATGGEGVSFACSYYPWFYLRLECICTLLGCYS